MNFILGITALVLLSSPCNAFTAVPNFLPARHLPASTRTNLILSAKASKGDVVSVNFNVKVAGAPTDEEDGTISDKLSFDTGNSITFLLGMGNYLPGLHNAVEGMTSGEIIKGFKMDAGYGPRDETNLVVTVEKEKGPPGLEVGQEMYLQNGHKVVVTDITEDTFTIDANHPLAGQEYLADVELIGVEKATTSGSKYSAKHDIATFALGCFWGGELAFMRQPGVVGTKVGYAQGEKENPTYQEVCSGMTGHTEAIRVVFDPLVVSYEELCRLAVARLGDSAFLENQVGNDKGTQYRSGIYYHNDEQKEVAAKVLGELGTECKVQSELASVFWDGEDDHQQYLMKGGQSAKKSATETIRCYG